MKEIISQVIEASPRKMITYKQFIELALYYPEKGYYMNNRQKIGKSGDFYTTSNVSDLFGKLMGKWYGKKAELLKLPAAVCEIGAGNGRFAKAFIQGWQETRNEQLSYYIVEASPYHRELQHGELNELEGVLIIHADSYPLTGMKEGLVFSNELFDAFPVHVIEKRNGMIQEVFIAMENGEFIEALHPMEEEKIKDFLSDHEITLVEGQRMEIPLTMEPFIHTLSDSLSRGLVITVDYGYTKEDWKDPARRKGSLRGYFQHQMYHDVLQYPGEMDITSHVHFDAIIAQGKKYGLDFLRKQRQDEFLLTIGILEELSEKYDPNPFSETSKRNRAIRDLIMPGSISQSFDVIIQGKGLNISSEQLFGQ